MPHPTAIGRYTILSEIGRGGMGTVYLAIDSAIDRRVAIKLLRQDAIADNPEVRERLWIEARAANRIGHPGVVQVSEVASLDDGTNYLIMEYLEGQTLAQRLRQRGGKLSVAEAIQYAAQIASTLSAGHQKGIVHRDLKPSNIMLVPDDAVPGGERVKLLDFGIAKIARLGMAAGLTLTNVSMGTDQDIFDFPSVAGVRTAQARAVRHQPKCSDTCGFSPSYCPPDTFHAREMFN